MNKYRNVLCSIVAVAVLVAVPARLTAKPNDITLHRLTTLDDCPLNEFCPDQLAFRKLMREFGYAVSPGKILPGETHGFGGGFFGMLGHITMISNDDDFWKKGTQENNPDSTLFLYQLTGQFVLVPYLLEWGFTIGYLFTTSDTTIGFNVKTSPFEGFRKKWYGWFPDIAFGFGMNRLVGDDEISMTTGTADVTLSYPFAPGGFIVLTPFVSIAFVGVVAESELIDATPNTNAFDESMCPINQGSAPGSAINCTNRSDDYNNSLKFSREWIYYLRISYGIRLIYELLHVSIYGSHGHQVMSEANDPGGTLGQFGFSLGLDF